jgi:hypothetical protein
MNKNIEFVLFFGLKLLKTNNNVNASYSKYIMKTYSTNNKKR